MGLREKCPQEQVCKLVEMIVDVPGVHFNKPNQRMLLVTSSYDCVVKAEYFLRSNTHYRVFRRQDISTSSTVVSYTHSPL